jgi:hypothetical protein
MFRYKKFIFLGSETFLQNNSLLCLFYVFTVLPAEFLVQNICKNNIKQGT